MRNTLAALAAAAGVACAGATTHLGVMERTHAVAAMAARFFDKPVEGATQ